MLTNSSMRIPLAVLVMSLAAAVVSVGQAHPQMSEEDIRRIAAEWQDRVFLVVADAGPCRASLKKVLDDPKSLNRKRRVGCAVALGQDGLLLSTASIVRPRQGKPDRTSATEDFVEVFNDRGDHVLARVIGRDDFLDLALLQMTDPLPGDGDIEPLVFGEALRSGETCMVLGNAFGRSLSATLGTFGSIVDIIPNGLPIRAYRVDAPIFPGDSGGPVLDTQGRFLGIVTAAAAYNEIQAFEAGISEESARELRLEGAASAGFAVPATSCEWAWTDLRKHGHVRRGYLGVEMSVANEQLGGARVLNVIPGSPAELIGIRANDLITSFNGKYVWSPRQFCALVAGTSPAVSLELRLIRDDIEHVMSAQLGEAPHPPRVQRMRPGREIRPTSNTVPASR